MSLDGFLERTNSWSRRGFNIVAIYTERHALVIHAFNARIIAIIVTRRLVRRTWIIHRRDTPPTTMPLTYPRDPKLPGSHIGA